MSRANFGKKVDEAVKKHVIKSWYSCTLVRKTVVSIAEMVDPSYYLNNRLPRYSLWEASHFYATL